MTYEAGTDDGSADVVQLDYIKSNHFRVIFVDGAIGSVSPSGMLQMALFSEREAIPRSIRHALNSDGRLGDEISSVRRADYVREVDVSATMSIETAKGLITWLQERVEELEQDGTGA